MVFLEPDPFLNELTKLYERNRQSGTVWVTLKRSNLKKTSKRKSGDGQEEASVPEASEYRCLVRATDGKRKISASADYGVNGDELVDEDWQFSTKDAQPGREPRSTRVEVAVRRSFHAWSILDLACLLAVLIFVELSPKDHQRFQMAYATVLRAHMDALKKREKKEKKDKKSNAKGGAV